MSHVYNGFTLVLATLCLSASLYVLIPQGNWMWIAMLAFSSVVITAALRNLKGE
jgi:hypothetical protein